MLLTPKAKPVRIRIESDGIEHSSLNSLREHFNVNDVINLCQKGSMSRWLEQQNETIVLNRLKAALAEDPNDEEKYILNIILSFFSDKDISGIKESKDLLLYWSWHHKYSNISSYLECIQDKNVLQTLLKSLNGECSEFIRKRLSQLCFTAGEIQEAAELGNQEALHKLNESLPAYISNFSSADIASFWELKDVANNREELRSKEFTSNIKDCVILISLIQDIESLSDKPEVLSNYLSQDVRICEKIWPEYLLPYITYIMCAVRKFIGFEEVKKLAFRVCHMFSTTSDFVITPGISGFKASQAENALFTGEIGYPIRNKITGTSLDYLVKVNTNDKDAFLKAINSIMSEILGD